MFLEPPNQPVKQQTEVDMVRFQLWLCFKWPATSVCGRACCVQCVLLSPFPTRVVNALLKRWLASSPPTRVFDPGHLGHYPGLSSARSSSPTHAQARTC